MYCVFYTPISTQTVGGSLHIFSRLYILCANSHNTLHFVTLLSLSRSLSVFFYVKIRRDADNAKFFVPSIYSNRQTLTFEYLREKNQRYAIKLATYKCRFSSRAKRQTRIITRIFVGFCTRESENQLFTRNRGNDEILRKKCFGVFLCFNMINLIFDSTH